jgi:hypothetical protein
MNRHRPQYVVKDLSGLVSAMASERRRLGFSQLAVDDRVGLTCGHTAKIEAGHRGLGSISLPNMLDALGLVIVLMPAGDAPCVTVPPVDRLRKPRERTTCRRDLADD